MELYTSCDLITTVYYFLRKKFGKNTLAFVERLNKIYFVTSFSNEELEIAIELMRNNTMFKDLEDTLQYILAKKKNCDLILSNDKEFYLLNIEALNVKEFWELLK